MMPPVIQTVRFPSGSETLEGSLVRPERDGLCPGVIVIHEAFGLNENIRDVARRLADQGYVALAVDLFAGRNRALCMFRFFSGIVLNSLDHGGIHDLKAALTFLTAQPGVDSTRVGAIGFCMGGSFAIAWAAADNRLKVIAPYYAMNPRPLAAVARLCPVVGSYPENDFTRGSGEKLGVELDRYQIPHDIKIYSGAKHSFFNETGSRYNAAAAEDSWKRVLSFFEQHLG
jgi:carboxymethylenebutenolidase